MFHVEQNFDVLVIGGGHAGIEACYLSAQFGLKVGLITLKSVPIGSAPCNPSIGGVGKGQVVKEIDALGGAMGFLADQSGIQYRTLNESKGYAVQSTRVQIDKNLYSKHATSLLGSIGNLEIIYDEVCSINKKPDHFAVKTKNYYVCSRTVIITVGTFLNGRLHVGEKVSEGGRLDCQKSSIGNVFNEIDCLPLRFKTGTPARLKKSSINYEKLERQPSDSKTRNFHLLGPSFKRSQKQVDCYLTRTNEQTMSLIRENKDKSPLFNGQIKGVGARYCPSIEDKAYRYPDKNVHHVFIEPEGHDLETVYPSGISTSLPEGIQNKLVKSIEGLEHAEIVHFGYAVEYDVLNTTQLDISLMLKNVPGMYFAGQVNGTSGYEEAAGQGLIAGINASLSVLGKEKFVLDRSESYIGVMIEDLVTNLRDEPYRLFTARAENRLYIREDNAFLRMYKYRKSLGINTEIDNFLDKSNIEYNQLLKIVKKCFFNEMFYVEHSEKLRDFIKKSDKKVSLEEVLKIPWVDPVEVLSFSLEKSKILINPDIVRTVAIEVKYSGYLTRSNAQLFKLKKLDEMKINVEKVLKSSNISFECKQRIKSVTPVNFGQLRKINGIRQATLAVIASGAY